MYNGILPVYKERGLTSHDVVFKLRKILKTKKQVTRVRFDPEVAGVLPVCIGNATRVSDYVMDMGKAYEATVSIGRSTTTEDRAGDTLETKGVHSADFNKDDIDRLLENFKGVIEQIPPMYSSVKVNGKNYMNMRVIMKQLKDQSVKLILKTLGVYLNQILKKMSVILKYASSVVKVHILERQQLILV